MPEISSESCRICLNEPKRTISLECTSKIFGKNYSYTELYQNVSGITLVSTGPQKLCTECSTLLVQAYELRKKIEQNELLLQNMADDVIVTKELDAVVNEHNMTLIKEERVERMDDNSFDFDLGTTIEADVDAVSVKVESETLKSEESFDDFTDDEKVNEAHNLRKRLKKRSFEKPMEKRRKQKRPKQEQQQLSLNCSICSQVFTKKFDFRNHYRVLHAGEEIKCPNCTRIFTDADEFDKHVRHGHKKRNREKTLCPHCAKVMLNTSIQEHIKSIHEEHHREYICDLCGVRAKSKDILTGHMKFKHQNLSYNCRYCPEIFKNKGTRRTHEIRFHTFDYKHICNICEKKFMTNAQLKKHRVIHTGEKPHSCDICGMRFSFRAGLKDHMATHAETRDFICEICTNAFKNMKALRKHKAVHEERNYECPVCGQKFLENKTLRAHCTHSHPDYVLPPPGTVMNKKALARVGEILEKYHVHAHHSSVPRKLTASTAETKAD